MKKITTRRYDLEGKVVYLEKSDCSYCMLTKWNDQHSWYEAKNEETGEELVLTPHDLIGNYEV